MRGKLQHFFFFFFFLCFCVFSLSDAFFSLLAACCFAALTTALNIKSSSFSQKRTQGMKISIVFCQRMQF